VTNKINAPVNVPVLNENGQPSLEWRAFFKELERTDKRTLTAISDSTSYTNDELRDFIIELRDVLINNKAVDE